MKRLIPLFTIPLGLFQTLLAGNPPDRIPLNVVEPASRTTPIHDYPVSTGLIFPNAELTSLPGGNLVDDKGQSVPFEAEATGWWEKEKKNVKWLLIHFNASTDRKYFFELGKKPPQPPKGNAIAQQNGGKISVDTGAMQVSMDASKGGLFETISLNGKPIASSAKKDLVLSIDDGQQSIPLTLSDWTMTIEESTPSRACVKASGFWKNAEGSPMARAQVRCKFFKGEAFVQIEHTLMWMIKDIKAGIRELSLAVDSQTGDAPEIQVGTGDPAETVSVALKKGTAVEAYQDKGNHFVIKDGDKTVKEGKNLAGWISEKGTDGRSVAMSLRHAWQRYPVVFRAEAGRIQTQFSPKQERLSFEQEAIMTPGIYNHPCWLGIRKIFNAPTNVTYFYDNTSPLTHFGYLYSAEGGAFTHELTLSFHDAKISRTAAELNSVNQLPLVVRQDPNHAMRVPFMGMNITAYDAEKQPEIERAVSQLGRIAMGRWIDTMNYGLTRFGMVRWGRHEPIENPQASFYRWMDNVQYCQQLIPWLLYMRGGERRFYDDGIIAGRYAMDMSTNHYNTRNCPTGYMTGSGSSLPFNPFPFLGSDAKLQKVHFLSYYYHLTGDKRAKEVMDEVIEGTKQYSLAREQELRAKNPDKKFYYTVSGGRENYNMNVFWANAWDETHDPEIWWLAENNRMCTIYGEYKPGRNFFEQPQVYIYDGLLVQDQRNPDQYAREIMLKRLNIDSLRSHGGTINSVEDAIAYPWAYEQTKDPTYAEAAWDVARGMADLVPDTDFEAEKVPPFYPYEYLGNGLYRQHLLPILTGATIGKQMGYDWKKKALYRDAFFNMWQRPGDKDFQAEVFVRARKDGPLQIRCMAEGNIKNPLQIEVVGANSIMKTYPPVQAKRNHPTIFHSDITIDNAKTGEIYKMKIRKADPAPLAVISEGQVVHHLPLELRHGQKSMAIMQFSTPIRFVTRANNDTMSFYNGSRRPYVLRDAETQDLIFRPKLYTLEESEHATAPGKMIMVTSGDSPNITEWLMKGVEPYFATRKEDWFQPEEQGWTEQEPVVKP